MALVIAGDRSGVGKTTVTLMMLAALARQSQYRQRVQSFKVEFHSSSGTGLSYL